jgi:hypothetical protein
MELVISAFRTYRQIAVRPDKDLSILFATSFRIRRIALPTRIEPARISVSSEEGGGDRPSVPLAGFVRDVAQMLRQARAQYRFAARVGHPDDESLPYERTGRREWKFDNYP